MQETCRSTKNPLKNVCGKLQVKSYYVSKQTRKFLKKGKKLNKDECLLKRPSGKAGEIEGIVYRTIHIAEVVLSTDRDQDSYFVVNLDGKKHHVKLVSIIDTGTEGVKLVGRIFLHENFAYSVTTDDWRFESSELGICNLSNLSEETEFFDLCKFLYKVVVHTFDDRKVAYPLLEY